MLQPTHLQLAKYAHLAVNNNNKIILFSQYDQHVISMRSQTSDH